MVGSTCTSIPLQLFNLCYFIRGYNNYKHEFVIAIYACVLWIENINNKHFVELFFFI